jgi:ABA4-like protein
MTRVPAWLEVAKFAIRLTEVGACRGILSNEIAMTPDQIFSAVNLIAVGSWVLLALLPRRRVANLVAGTAVPALLAAVYVAIIATKWAGSSGGFNSLSAVALLFSNRWLLLAGWTHYLAFDLFVGSWEVRGRRTRPSSAIDTGTPAAIIPAND